MVKKVKNRQMVYFSCCLWALTASKQLIQSPNRAGNRKRALLLCLLAVEHFDVLNICPEGEPMMSCEDCGDSSTDETLLETKPIQSPLQVFAGMGGLALIAERLPMLYPDVIQQVRL